MSSSTPSVVLIVIERSSARPHYNTISYKIVGVTTNYYIRKKGDPKKKERMSARNSLRFVSRRPRLCSSFPAKQQLQQRTLFTSRKTPTPVRNFFINTALLVGIGAGVYYATDARSAFLRYIVVPTIRWTMDAETAHRLAIDLMKAGISPVDRSKDAEDPDLEVKVRHKEIRSFFLFFCWLTWNRK